MYIEHELFGQESPTAKFKQQYGYSVNGLKGEDTVASLVRELVPLFDLCNRAVPRNVQALKAVREPAMPTVAIASAGQVNVGAQQSNTVQPPATNTSRASLATASLASAAEGLEEKVGERTRLGRPHPRSVARLRPALGRARR
jgi:hypothetical protein